MTLHAIPHDGLVFACEIDGPPDPSSDTPWLVFSNSLVTNLGLWQPQLAAFPAYRTLRYDQRGHGGTSVPGHPATIEQLAEDAAALMTRFGVRQATFIGVSMGAATGFRLAQTRPDLVARLVASDGQAASPPGGAQSWADRIAVAERGGMTAYADATLPRWFAARSHAEAHPVIPEVRTMIETTPLAGFVACARALQSYDFRQGLAYMTQPTLLIAGAEDGVMPQTLKALESRIPQAEYVEIADAGHLPGIERPDAFNAALRAFLP